MTLLHQGDLIELRRYSGAVFSETAARSTNLFKAPAPVEVDGRFLEDGLIHKSRSGITVRSKSEVIIADLLYSKHIDFEYEQRIVGNDGSWRSPDFTIIDDTTGMTIYWEHLGMLQRPSYRRKWEAKLAWYRANGILPAITPMAPSPQRISKHSLTRSWAEPSCSNSRRGTWMSWRWSNFGSRFVRNCEFGPSRISEYPTEQRL